MAQALPFPLGVCGCDDFILPRSDSNGGVDDSNRDNDEGDNEVFVPVGGGPLRGWGGGALLASLSCGDSCFRGGEALTLC